MKKCYQRAICYFYQPSTQRVLKVLIALCFIGITTHAFADDLLKGTETNLVDTLNGTGKKYLYIAEGLMSLLLYIKTKNVMLLVGILIVSIFFNIMLKMAGV